MGKGVWARNLLSLLLKGELSLRDSLSFALARIQPKPLSFEIQGVKYVDVDHILWSTIADVFVNRVYSPVGMKILSDDIVVDIGAHRGGFTGFAARQTANSVFAYEPNEENFSHLEKMVANNNFTNVIARNVAVGGHTGKARLRLSSVSSRHRLETASGVAGDHLNEKNAEVTILSLDDCLADLNAVDLLKLDCEGAEYEILLQAKDETLSKIQKIAAEVHDPPNSLKVNELCRRIKSHFSFIEVKDQEQLGLGYLYASRPKALT